MLTLTPPKYRLVTRSDFDGLVCAVLLKELDMIDDIKFVHPKDMQDGKIDITDRDITTNLPYVGAAHMVFDHHLSETIRNVNTNQNHIINPDAPSAARVVYEYFGGASRFPTIATEMMLAVDKADAAQFDRSDVLQPESWELLSFLMDARTGLGRFRDFTVSNYQLMMQLIDYCKNHTIAEILELPDVKERVELYFDQAPKFKAQIQRCATVHDALVVLDLRQEEIIYCGNRFMIYALFPECNISMHVMCGLKQQNTVLAVGKSIFDRSCGINIGQLMLENEGGGHFNAGTCQVPNESADDIINMLIPKLQG